MGNIKTSKENLMENFDSMNDIIQSMLWEGEVPSHPEKLNDEGKVIFIYQFILDCGGILSQSEIDSVNRIYNESPLVGDSERVSLIIERELREKRFSLVHIEGGWDYQSSNSYLELEELRSGIGENFRPEEFHIVEN